MTDDTRKTYSEETIANQIKELFDEDDIYNNETFNFKVQKMKEVLSRLQPPNQPVKNEYLKEIFLRVRRKIDLNENYENN
mgnify:CR=1 FL=1|tara:strand:- start:3543 stop:3782 length:240 start_codon:yes stop_codon:yes gene_type:complete